jgi:hypothetical protein
MKALLTMVIMMGMGCTFLLGIYVGRETAGLRVPDSVAELFKKNFAGQSDEAGTAQGGPGGSKGAASEPVAKSEASQPSAPSGVSEPKAPVPVQAPGQERLVPLKHVDGRSIQAELVSLRDGMVKIRRDDGREFEFSLTHLQAADQRRVREHFAGGATNKTPAAGGGGGEDAFVGILDYVEHLNEAAK